MSKSNLSIEFAQRAAKACDLAKLYDPENEIPALVAFADAAEVHRDAWLHYETERSAWAKFSATAPHDDPAHADHHTRTSAARQALNAAQERLDTALIQLRAARGES